MPYRGSETGVPFSYGAAPRHLNSLETAVHPDWQRTNQLDIDSNLIRINTLAMAERNKEAVGNLERPYFGTIASADSNKLGISRL